MRSRSHSGAPTRANDDVRSAQQIREQPFVPAIAPHHLKPLLAATIHQAVLTIEKVVEDRDVISPVEQASAEHRADVTGSAGDEHMS
jgi:hypothetical protein